MHSKSFGQKFSGICMRPGQVIASSYKLQHTKTQCSIYQRSFPTLRERVLKTLDNDITQAHSVSEVLVSILISYKEVIKDNNLKSMIETLTLSGVSLPDAIDEYFSSLMLTLSEYNSLDKQSDIRDIYNRFQKEMGYQKKSFIYMFTNVILVCKDITISDFLFLPLDKVKAIVITQGHRTSHVVELIDNLNIPLVIQADDNILSIDHPVKLSLRHNTIEVMA